MYTSPHLKQGQLLLDLTLYTVQLPVNSFHPEDRRQTALAIDDLATLHESLYALYNDGVLPLWLCKDRPHSGMIPLRYD